MSAALFARIRSTAIGTLLNLFAMLYFLVRGGNLVYLAIAHGLMFLLLMRILSVKVQSFRDEQAEAARKKAELNAGD